MTKCYQRNQFPYYSINDICDPDTPKQLAQLNLASVSLGEVDVVVSIFLGYVCLRMASSEGDAAGAATTGAQETADGALAAAKAAQKTADQAQAKAQQALDAETTQGAAAARRKAFARKLLQFEGTADKQATARRGFKAQQSVVPFLTANLCTGINIGLVGIINFASYTLALVSNDIALQIIENCQTAYYDEANALCNCNNSVPYSFTDVGSCSLTLTENDPYSNIPAANFVYTVGYGQSAKQISIPGSYTYIKASNTAYEGYSKLGTKLLMAIESVLTPTCDNNMLNYINSTIGDGPNLCLQLLAPQSGTTSTSSFTNFLSKIGNIIYDATPSSTPITCVHGDITFSGPNIPEYPISYYQYPLNVTGESILSLLVKAMHNDTCF